MARAAILWVLWTVLCGSAVALSDVPKGECYTCEVTCFEDCALKYDREIIQADALLQTNKGKQNKTVEMTNAYGQCLVDEKCPCRAAQADTTSKSKQLQLVAAEKKRGKCAVNAVSCSAKCAQKAIPQQPKSLLQNQEFPLHSVKINVFAKGAMLMDTCLKYCLAATCGCQDAPGFEKREELVKANKKAGPGVTDTPAAPQYRPAKIDECAKGMPGKKVAKGLYIKLGGGPMDYVEVCTSKFLSAIGAPNAAAKCKSGASEDAKYGCIWSEKKNMCVVGFSPILKCMTKYINDPTP